MITTVLSKKMTLGASRANQESAARLAAFRRVYDEQEARVRKTLYWLVGADAANDVLQEVFLKVWQNFDRFRGEAKVSTWIYRIAVNSAYDHFRSRSKVEVTAELDRLDEGANAEKQLGMHQVIAKGLAALPEKLRAAFVLFYKEELSLEEVAQALELPVGTVKSRLHEAREQFKAALMRQGASYE